MSRRDELIEEYARDIREKCEMEPDMDLLTKVTIGCEPAIYSPDAATVAGTDGAELETIRQNFLIGKLGLPDNDSLMGGIQKSIRIYGRSDTGKYRAVLYYLLVKHFGKEDAYT